MWTILEKDVQYSISQLRCLLVHDTSTYLVIGDGNIGDSWTCHKTRLYHCSFHAYFQSSDCYWFQGGHNGDAVGFKLNSLMKLTETRANKPRMNLMHYVVMVSQLTQLLSPSVVNIHRNELLRSNSFQWHCQWFTVCIPLSVSEYISNLKIIWS